jgi:hypothetical protein
MKNSIKLTALLVLASVSVFAANPSKIKASAAKSKSIVTFASLPSNKGVEVKVESNEPAKAAVIIYDADKNVVFKDVMSSSKSMEKGYVFNQLENGDYTIEVTSNHQTEKKNIHVYDEYKTKAFIVTE